MNPHTLPWRLLFLLTLMLVVPLGAEDKVHKVRYRMQIFRISGNFSIELSLKKPIWKGTQKDWDRIKDSVQLFDQGTFQLGKDKLEINRRGCFWNRRQISFGSNDQDTLPADKIKMIYSPNIVRDSKQPVRMKISSERPFHYMRRREDGCFELMAMPLPVGLDIEICAENLSGDFFLLSLLNLTLRTVTERERIPGVDLPIGRPLLHTSEYALRLFLEEDKIYGILLRLPESGAIVIRLELDDR